MSQPGTEDALDVTSGNIVKQLGILMWPIFITFLFQQMYGISNLLIVSYFAGKSALGAIQATRPLLDLAISLSLGIGAGCGVIVGQYYGEHNDERLSDSSHTAITLALIGGVIASIIAIACAKPLLNLMATPAELWEESLQFAYEYLGGLVFSITLNMGAGIMRAVGNPKTPSYVIGITCVVNVILDLIFVGYFDMGALGCGIATSASMGVGSVIMLWILHRAHGAWKIDFKKLRIDPKLLSIMLKTGVPIGIQGGVYGLSNMIAQSAINQFGTDAIAAWGISLQINNLIWIVADSLAIALTAFCAQNFGARNYKRMKEGLHVALKLSIIGIGILSAIVYFQAYNISLLFIDDMSVVQGSVHILHFIIPFVIVFTVMDCISGVIRASGETFKPMLLTIVGTCVLRIGWIEGMMIIKPEFDTVLTSYPVSWCATALLFILYYRRGTWLNRSIEKKKSNDLLLDKEESLSKEDQTALDTAA